MGAQCLWEPKTMKTDPKCPPKCQLELLGLGFFILRINRSVLSLTSLRFPLSSFGTYIPSQRRLINSPSSVSMTSLYHDVAYCISPDQQVELHPHSSNVAHLFLMNPQNCWWREIVEFRIWRSFISAFWSAKCHIHWVMFVKSTIPNWVFGL